MEEVNASLATYGYIALFLYSFGGGYVGIVAAGILSYLGEMNIVISIIVATTANFLGDTMLFYMGRYNKPMLNPYLIKHRRKFALSHILIKRFGDAIIVFQKYIYGVKTLVPIAIGITKYPFGRFTIINALASILWGIAVGLSSYYAGSVLVPYVEYIGAHYYYLLLFLAAIGGSVWLYFHLATRKKR
ncbi:MAG: membrane protein [Sulfuricurvum sp. PC08-66]|nr:MAG: membrane protein [Sulfuricurvum sp. PC08-66]